MRQKTVFYIFLLLFVMAAQAFAMPENQKLKGVLSDMNIKKKFFSVSVGGENTTFLVNKDTVFQQKDHKVFFSDIVPGDTVEVIYQVKWRKKWAQLVQVEPSRWRKKSYEGVYGY